MARSALKRHPPRIGDLDAHHLYGRALGGSYDFALCCGEAFVDEACDHSSFESVSDRELALCDAVRKDREER
jgi:hypothetical protein